MRILKDTIREFVAKDLRHEYFTTKNNKRKASIFKKFK